MSTTVPKNVKPSGGLVEPFLAGIPTQPAAASVETLKPRSWSFVDRATGKRQTVTCMPGCVADHSGDMASPTFRDDIWCYQEPESLTLPINVNGEPEEFRVLGVMVNVNPFDRQVSQRLPHADVEVVDDHWIEGLDPDGLETVINSLAQRLDRLRGVQAELVALRAEYRKQAQA
ncbi:hypothetical protein AB0J57_04990 [Streptomyces sp. NPDC049837]|uniref:DUF6907 domain-containing protein n=1 Tax=Streptomyces sp. NPDC049837 TaxID=3155277 RepID=UPI0034324316